MHDDKAWAEFKTPLHQRRLYQFCRNVERLFRINLYLIINKWEQINKHDYRINISNSSQTPSFEVVTDAKIYYEENDIKIVYANGIKESTTFSISDDDAGSKLEITEHYRSSNKNNLNTVDRSITAWAKDIQSYLISWHKWSWFPTWTLYQEKVWLPMKPTGRRIVYILLWISVVEIVLIVLGITIYFLEYR